MDAGRSDRVPRPCRRPDQAPRLPHRTRRGRGRSGTPSRRGPRRRRRPGGPAGRPPAGVLRRTGAARRGRRVRLGRGRRRLALRLRGPVPAGAGITGVRQGLPRLALQLRRRRDPGRGDGAVAPGDGRPHPRTGAAPGARDRRRQRPAPVADRTGVRQLLGHGLLRTGDHPALRRSQAGAGTVRAGDPARAGRRRRVRTARRLLRHDRRQLRGAVLPERGLPVGGPRQGTRPAGPRRRDPHRRRPELPSRNAVPHRCAGRPGRQRRTGVGAAPGDRPRGGVRQRTPAGPGLLRRLGAARSPRRFRGRTRQTGCLPQRAEPVPLRRRPAHARRGAGG